VGGISIEWVAPPTEAQFVGFEVDTIPVMDMQPEWHHMAHTKIVRSLLAPTSNAFSLARGLVFRAFQVLPVILRGPHAR
jgi:hypothetical protein